MASLKVLVILALASFHAVSAWLSPVDTHCTSSASTCPSHSSCVLPKPCMWGTMCECDSGYKQWTRYDINTGLVQICVPATAKVDETCDDTVQCSGTYTICGGLSKCVCRAGHTVNSDKSDCTPPAIVALGANCTGVALQCGYGAICKNTVCQCSPGYKKYNTTDCNHYAIGETCGASTECEEERCGYGSCEDGTFQCTHGMRWYGRQVDEHLIDGFCIPKRTDVVGRDEYCESNDLLISDQVCSFGLYCATCPERPFINRCIGNGASSAVLQVSTAVTALLSLVFCLATRR